MKKIILFIALFFGLSQICKSIDALPIEKVYFHIPDNYPHIVVPVSINDSTQANLMFDTGGGLWLDSIFGAQNKIKMDNDIVLFQNRLTPKRTKR